MILELYNFVILIRTRKYEIPHAARVGSIVYIYPNNVYFYFFFGKRTMEYITVELVEKS